MTLAERALARIEARVAVEELTRRLPRLELAGAPARRPLLVLHGFESVHVRIRPRDAGHRRAANITGRAAARSRRESA